MSRRRFVVADDHPLFREAMKQTLHDFLAGCETQMAGSFDQAVALLESGEDFDLVLLDLKMPGAQGLSGLVYLRAQFPNVPVAIVSANDDPAVMRRALSLGASGFIPKSSSAGDMREAIEAMLDGGIWTPPDLNAEEPQDGETEDLARRLMTLTPQQMRVLMLLREGMLNKQIAFNLSVSEATVKAHVSAILQKLKVDSRTQAVIAAGRLDGDMQTPLAN